MNMAKHTIHIGVEAIVKTNLLIIDVITIIATQTTIKISNPLINFSIYISPFIKKGDCL